MEIKSGCVFLYKPVGLTSRQAGAVVGRYFNTRKIGHLGTLDPFAEGLLIIMVNKATKIAPFIDDDKKVYRATLKLGTKTDTADLTGNIIERKDIPSLSKEDITKVFASFLGKSWQIPPMYSALKVNGEHLYDLARDGKSIDRKPREIEIFSLQLIAFKDDEITFLCEVSKGTYIRTLGEDIANKLGTVGHLTKLIREGIGPYKIDSATKIDSINDSSLVDICNVLFNIPKFKVSGPMEKIALNGGQLYLNYKDPYVLVLNNDGPIAIYSYIDVGVYSCARGLR